MTCWCPDVCGQPDPRTGHHEPILCVPCAIAQHDETQISNDQQEEHPMSQPVTARYRRTYEAYEALAADHLPADLSANETFNVLAEIVYEANSLRRLLNVARADRPLTVAELAVVARISRRIQQRAARLGIPATINDAPEGGAVTLTLPNGRSNTPSGQGWVL